MKTKGKAWQLVLTVLLIAAFVYTAFFGVAVKYGDVTTTYIKGAKDIRFGVDIKGGVNVTFSLPTAMTPPTTSSRLLSWSSRTVWSPST